jgi:hypothetical protein
MKKPRDGDVIVSKREDLPATELLSFLKEVSGSATRTGRECPYDVERTSGATDMPALTSPSAPLSS